MLLQARFFRVMRTDATCFDSSQRAALEGGKAPVWMFFYDKTVVRKIVVKLMLTFI